VRFFAALTVFLLSCVVVAGLFVEGSRQYITIWLPFTLAALVGWVLAPVGANSVRTLVWLAVSCGALLMWLLSEPEVSFHDHPELRYVAIVLAAVCACLFALMVARSFSSEGGVYRWALAIVCMSWLIAFFSSPSGGSGGMISMAMRWFSLSPDQAETLVFVVRKTIHFSFYGLLGWTGFRWALSLDVGLRRAVLLGLGLVFVHACFDEGRQTFFADRTASVFDVLLDVSGACVLVGANALLRKSRISRRAAE